MKVICKFIRSVIILFFTSSLLAVVAYRFIPVYVTPLMVMRSITALCDGKMPEIHHKWVSMKDISPELPIAVMASEDSNFMSHHGFDFNAISRAAKRNSKGKKVLLGGSTITQQTAKNVFLLPNRTWIRKGLESYFTVLIELMWSKERIMEVYLNSIEMGNGLFGAHAVAEYHFNKVPQSLNAADCALIAASLPNPLLFDSANPSPDMHKRQKKILHEMNYLVNSGKVKKK